MRKTVIRNHDVRKSPEMDFMLKMQPNCECCDRDLPGDSQDAMICSFECTYCCDCAKKVLNCGVQIAVEKSCAAQCVLRTICTSFLPPRSASTIRHFRLGVRRAEGEKVVPVEII